MTLEQWQDYIAARWPLTSRNLVIASLGLPGEVGEVIEHVKKHIRDDKVPDPVELKLELGDVLHYLTVVAWFYGYTLGEIMVANKTKLDARDLRKATA